MLSSSPLWPKDQSRVHLLLCISCIPFVFFSRMRWFVLILSKPFEDVVCSSIPPTTIPRVYAEHRYFAIGRAGTGRW